MRFKSCTTKVNAIGFNITRERKKERKKGRKLKNGGKERKRTNGKRKSGDNTSSI